MEYTTHLDYIPAADGLRLYEVSIAYVEPGTKKRRVIGTHICGASNAQEAVDLAHTELWVEPHKSSGCASDQQCQELDRYLSCPSMAPDFIAAEPNVSGPRIRWTMDRVTGMLVDADEIDGGDTGFKWIAMDSQGRSQLQAHLEDADVESDPEVCGAFAVCALPDWSAAAPKPPASDIAPASWPGARAAPAADRRIARTCDAPAAINGTTTPRSSPTVLVSRSSKGMLRSCSSTSLSD